MKARTAHVAVAAGAAVAAWCLWQATLSSGGPAAPEFSEDAPNPLAAHLATAAELHQVTSLPHAYPARVGGEVTAIIRGGWSAAGIPCGPGSDWMTRPPSEQGVLT